MSLPALTGIDATHGQELNSLANAVNGLVSAVNAGGLAAIASDTLLANTTGGSAAPVATSLSTLLDAVFGTTQGAVLYRGASTWAALSSGSSGQVLTSQGSGANPQWAAAAGGVSEGFAMAVASRNIVM